MHNFISVKNTHPVIPVFSVSLSLGEAHLYVARRQAIPAQTRLLIHPKAYPIPNAFSSHPPPMSSHLFLSLPSFEAFAIYSLSLTVSSHPYPYRILFLRCPPRACTHLVRHLELGCTFNALSMAFTIHPCTSGNARFCDSASCHGLLSLQQRCISSSEN